MHRALRRPLVAVLVVLVVLVAVGLSILPEVVRRIAVREATKLTGRAVSLAVGVAILPESRSSRTRTTASRSTSRSRAS